MLPKPPLPPPEETDASDGVLKFGIAGLAFLAVGMASALTIEFERGTSPVVRTDTPVEIFAGEMVATVISSDDQFAAGSAEEESIPSAVTAPTEVPVVAIVASVSGSTVTLTWSDLTQTETAYHLTRTSELDDEAIFITLPKDTTEFVDIDLVSGTRYEYWLSACNAEGCTEPLQAVVTLGR
jgi:hypothetical protein